ncbi:MAG: hypothetical protein M3Z03_17780 [Actinomycetota bacterium]|nr:hypothetical protein [Actinomycetota bacterium]
MLAVRTPRALATTILAAALFVGSCSGDDSASKQSGTSNTGAVNETTSTTTPLTIDGVLSRLTAAGIPVSGAVFYDESTDGNKLLGRPGQYVGKVSWIHGTIECFEPESPGVDCGGSIEIFENDEDRDRRFEYLGGFAEESPIGGYYMWKIPRMVVRVGFEVPPSEAQAYAVALEGAAPGQVMEY